MPDVRTPSPSLSTPLDALIVGAGFAGLYMLHRLRGLGLRARVFEAGSGIGGTWFWNRYPGARCDVESIDYSYSFSPELEQEWEWTHRYPGQAEILRYIESVADRFDLHRDIRTGTRVTAAAFDGAEAVWRVRTADGADTAARHLIMATGCLSVPKAPEIDGLDRFGGRLLHTARWPHEGADFTGRRVAVIGTGSSGVQSVPVIAGQAAALTVFQRTANFSLPARNAPLSAEALAEARRGYPERRRLARASHTGVPMPEPQASALEVPAAEREAAYRRHWERGGLFGIFRSYTDVLTDAEANRTAADFIRERVREAVADPRAAEALTPRGHPFGTKRPCLDTGYYQAFNRDGVDVVDLRAEPIERVTREGVRTSAREYPFDDIVLATGFDAMTGALTAVDLRGRGGTGLRGAWAGGWRTYLGLGMAGFPNLFTVTGPGSPSVLSNMLVSIEQHVEWIGDCIAALRDRGAAVIEPTPQAQEAWTAHVGEAAEATLFPRADSWYLGANVPGKPRVFMPYVGGVGPYRELCTQVAEDGYAGFAIA
ncbi:flavin-containing monooxygenase [Nocardiopsis composta]|uniref:Cyclohexanone monooxygenase n=1 Tax=Nocardiopsis composta TaxID=157465 RepID=A0A7W8VBP9_9ACTN|nr:NAD(P)/FAD-dependent oxidoreductase [Nocardiopsis composta]MBB5430104.1 cyclohexanone monooxygenase [Nocardiopsis composta]